MQYTIEARELTSGSRHRPEGDVGSSRMTVDAIDAGEAITYFVEACAGELVSLSSPARGRESIATVRKADTMFLVRVYTP